MIIDAQGKLLIAPPGMPDPRFRKTVVFVWRHDVSGASGVVINKKCQRPTFKHICEEGNISRKPDIKPSVYYGGPILNNVVGVLHSTEYKLASTNNLAKGNIGFTLDSKILQDVAQGKGPLNVMITLGMASWNSSQLEEEMEHPHAPGMSWLVLDYDEKLVFGQLADSKPDDIWEDCVSRAIRSKTAEITSKIFKN
jgi:putative transcriptional regulator|tara:strand:- start:36 stop:623 length:588 start_codon:yes stop_codon:yes gene_type:complete